MPSRTDVSSTSNANVLATRTAPFSLHTGRGVFPSFIAPAATLWGLGRVVSRGAGTLGALAALPLLPLLHALPVLERAVVLVVLTAAAAWAIGAYVAEPGKAEDPQEVILDEAIGVLWALAFVAATPLSMAAGFVLFRLFDIAKPGPVAWADEHLRGWAGVLGDDVLAGLLAAAFLTAFS